MAGPVVVGLDGTGNSVPAVLWGAEEAAARGLALHLLLAEAFAALAGEVPRGRGGPACGERPGRPVLPAACRDAGLLVVGRRSRRPPMLLGPVVHAALHHANCPVSVVPQG